MTRWHPTRRRIQGLLPGRQSVCPQPERGRGGGPSATGDGTQVQLWSYGGGTNQQWQPVALGGGNYKFVARNSGKCLDVRNVSTANGARLQQWTCTLTPSSIRAGGSRRPVRSVAVLSSAEVRHDRSEVAIQRLDGVHDQRTRPVREGGQSLLDARPVPGVMPARDAPVSALHPLPVQGRIRAHADDDAEVGAERVGEAAPPVASADVLGRSVENGGLPLGELPVRQGRQQFLGMPRRSGRW